MVPLVFKAVKPTLGRRIVPAVTFATHRASHAIFLEFALKGMAGIPEADIASTIQIYLLYDYLVPEQLETTLRYPELMRTHN